MVVSRGWGEEGEREVNASWVHNFGLARWKGFWRWMVVKVAQYYLFI